MLPRAAAAAGPAMTAPGSPLSPSSHSSFDDEDDEAPFHSKAEQQQPPPSASAPRSSPASPHMPPLLHKPAADEQSSASSLSSSRRHSLSSSSSTSTASLASPHTASPSHLNARLHLADTSLSSAASTPSSTPSSSAASKPTSPFIPAHSLVHLTQAAAAQQQANAEQQQQQHGGTLKVEPSELQPSSAHSSLSGGLSMSQLASEAAVLANSNTLHKAVLAATAHHALMQQQQQQQQKVMNSLASAYPAASGNALTALSNTLSSLQYANRAPLPAPLASLPPLALSFSSHTSGSALTPSAVAAAASSGLNSTLSNFASQLHSNLFKQHASAGLMSQLLHANSHTAAMLGVSSAPHSPLSAASMQQANGINWALALPAAATAPVSPQPFTTPPRSASPGSTPPTFPASSSVSSLASLSALALPSTHNSAASGDMPPQTNSSLRPPSPYTTNAPLSPSAPSLPPILTAPSSTLSPYAYSPSSSSSAGTSLSLSALTTPGTFGRLPSLPLNLPSPTLQSLYPAHLSHLLPGAATPFTPNPSALSSASFAGLTGSSSSPLSSHAGLSGVSWPSTSASSLPASAAGGPLHRYLIHFPADTAHGAQSGLYQPGKPSQLIIHMAEADAAAAQHPPPSVPASTGSSAAVKEETAESLPSGHSMVRIPVKVAIKPTVKRTAKLRSLHEVSLHPGWYDCESRDLSEEEKRWETGSKAKKPKHLLLRHDTKSCIHVMQVARWTADEQNNSEALADEQSTAGTTARERDGMTGSSSSPSAASTSSASSISTSAALSGLLNSLTAAGGSPPFVSQSGSFSFSLLPLHILPVSDDSMAHVQTKGRGKTEERRKETAQLYLSLKVDKWYELRCHGGWRIVEMEMKHHKGGHQISSVAIPFHFLPGDLTVSEGVQAITLLATGSQPQPLSDASHTTGKKGRGGSATKQEADDKENSGGKAAGNGKRRNNASRDEEQHESNGSSSRKGGRGGGVKQEAGTEKSNGGRTSTKRRHSSRDSKQSAAAAVAAAEAAEQDKKQQQQQASSEARSIQNKNLQHLALVNSMIPFAPSGPTTVYMQHPASFSQLSPSSPSGASYPQLPSVPSSLPLSISAFDPSLLLQQPGTPNASLMSPNTAHMLSGQLSPGTLFANITNEQYAAMVRRGGVGAGNASPGGGEGLNFYISTNSAFKTRAGSKGSNADKGEEDGAAAEGDSGQKRRKVESGGSVDGQDGEENKPEGAHDDSGSTLSGGSAGDDMLLASNTSSSSPNAASGGNKQPPRDVSAMDPLMFDSSFLLRSESSASTFSLPGTTISLHPFTSVAGTHSLLPPPPSTYHNAAAAAAAAAVAAASANQHSHSSGASKPHHPPPSIKIPTASRLSPSLSPLLSQSLAMTLSPSPSLNSGSANYYALSPPPSTPSLMDSEGLFAAVSAAGMERGHSAVRRSV